MSFSPFASGIDCGSLHLFVFPPFPFSFLDEKLPLISGTRVFLPAFGVYLYTDLRTATVWFASVMNLRYFRSADMFREEKVLET